MKSMEIRRNELLADVASRAEELCRDLGLPPDQAEQVGAAIADTLADDFGGQVISFPKDHAFRLSKRDQAILEAHRAGASLVKLMRDYCMTERGLRRLLQRAEARDRSLRQPGLFGDASHP
jgi:Mor family transcriptional regulator